MGKMKASSHNKYRPIPVWMRYAPEERSGSKTVLNRENRYSSLATSPENFCPHHKLSRMSLTLCQKLVVHSKKKTEKI